MVELSCLKERINERRPYIFVEWSCTKERINERGSFTFVEWSCTYKRNKSVGTLNSCRMVVHIDLAKMLEHGESISPSSFYGQLSGLLVTRF